MFSPQEQKMVSRITNEKKIKLTMAVTIIACLASLCFFFYLGNKIAGISHKVYQFGSTKISSIKTETPKEQALKKMLLNYHQIYMDGGDVFAIKFLSLLAEFVIIFSALLIVFLVRDIKIGRIIKKLQQE